MSRTVIIGFCCLLEVVQMDEDIIANISSYNEAAIELSEDEGEIDSDLEETTESDYDSPGH
jgi:hypothetical protein